MSFWMDSERVAASSAAWGWLSPPTIPKAYGFEAATQSLVEYP